ncbi:hypothetical protein [Bradyrhizobium genosp. P]|uniref:hypothetical protein n=1 Tax=Bradyrhizobium genosp. P TaxID=83641 RepID=UPI003CF1F4A3
MVAALLGNGLGGAGQRFRAYVEQQLVPVLKPGDIVVTAYSPDRAGRRQDHIAQKRTLEDTWRHIGELVTTIQPHECSNYFENAGYASPKA